MLVIYKPYCAYGMFSPKAKPVMTVDVVDLIIKREKQLRVGEPAELSYFVRSRGLSNDEFVIPDSLRTEIQRRMYYSALLKFHRSKFLTVHYRFREPGYSAIHYLDEIYEVVANYVPPELGLSPQAKKYIQKYSLQHELYMRLMTDRGLRVGDIPKIGKKTIKALEVWVGRSLK